ncbi:MAG: S26 family signal peptidase [Methanomassiliicoccaceae archaeon]|nr:S26 family signal peptidase [Methanomassiliicoccaceae archaeon]
MEKNIRNTIIIAVVCLAVLAGAYVSVSLYSGTSPTFYTVESGSMRHSDRSAIGIIDTGDMVLVRDPSKVNITTYTEGYVTGYKKFGGYGDVVIYKRESGTPVIHRVILELTDNGNGTWSAPSLQDYTKWYIGSPGDRPDTGALSGRIHFTDLGFEVSLNTLKSIGAGNSGYITKGDANGAADQSVDSIMLNTLVTDKMIIAVAAHELPWLGCIKLYINGTNTDHIPSNSLPLLIGTIVLIMAAMVVAGLLYERHKKKE